MHHILNPCIVDLMKDDIFAEAIVHFNDCIILLRKHDCQELINFVAKTMVQTRWTNAYDSCESILQHKTAIEELLHVEMIPLAIRKFYQDERFACFQHRNLP
jgi:hypothetical protein